jgi:AraC-like DNA-binding protein
MFIISNRIAGTRTPSAEEGRSHATNLYRRRRKEFPAPKRFIVSLWIMPTETLYLLLTFASAVAMTLFGCLLLGIHIPREQRMVKLRVARLVLAVSYFVLSIPNYTEYFFRMDTDTRVIASFTLATAAFQSLLFTATMLTFILPSYVTRRRILSQIGGVVVGVAIFLTGVFYCRNPHLVLAVGMTAYVGQLVCYTLLFRRKYAESLKRLEEYYDEDVHARLRWVKCGFYAALSIGIAAAVSAYLPASLYNLFTITYTLFYAWFVLRFFNYAAKVYYYLPTVAHTEQKTEEPEAVAVCTDFTPVKNEEKAVALKQSLDRWIADRGYTKSDVGIEQIAAELGTDLYFLRNYFRTRMSSDFRSWRSELRIREAQRIMDEEPELSVTQVGERVGIADRSNFRILFCKIAGMSPSQYKSESENRER